LCDQYAGTLRQLSRSSLKAKSGILARLKADWPEGEEHFVAAVKPSHLRRMVGETTGEGQTFSLQRLHQFLRAIFESLFGLGQAEANAHTLPDIDLERGQITTFRHKTRTGLAIPIIGGHVVVALVV
jgi:hypothetical protein